MRLKVKFDSDFLKLGTIYDVSLGTLPDGRIVARVRDKAGNERAIYYETLESFCEDWEDVFAGKSGQQGVNVDGWADRAIKSELAGVLIAPEDFYIINKDGKKKTHFTYDEAMEATKDLPGGWRLPTRHEWTLIAEEFGNDPKTNRPSSQALLDTLDLGLNGFLGDGEDTPDLSSFVGYYWSSTVYSSEYAYRLSVYSSEFNPSSSYYHRNFGYSVRCVKDIKKGER